MKYLDSEVTMKTVPETVDGCGNFFECTCRYVGSVKDGNLSSPDTENKIIAQFKIDKLLESCLTDADEFGKCRDRDFNFYGGGWQSWGFGGELEPGRRQRNYIPLIPQWKNYVVFPGKWPSTVFGKRTKSSSLLKGQFLIYLRWENTYLVVASTGSINDDGPCLPPVQFYVDRKSRGIVATIYADGKRWEKMELMGRFAIFTANSFFGLKNGTRFVYGSGGDGRFDYLNFLNGDAGPIKCAGWESWYNHYSDINENLIQKDLEALGENGNIINSMYRWNGKPVVFQVDDGWEKSLGDWEANQSRFPEGMEKLAESISEKGYIPGLWIAPLIVDLRSDTAASHPEWILRNGKGRPVCAGMNPLWGAGIGFKQPSYPWSYFCLDLSRDDVLEYLDGLMEKVINQWGFRYIKLDFLFAGMLFGEYANGGASYVWYERAIKKLTRRLINSKGERVAYLGCGLPFESSFTSLPLSRIGPDTKECWDVGYLRIINYAARTGAKPNLQSTLGHAFWDQIVYVNDPDVIFLRNTNIKLDDGEKELIAIVNKIFASQIMHSDDPCDFSADEADFTKHITGVYEKLDGEEFGHVNITSNVYQVFSRNGKYCGLINLSQKPYTVEIKKMISQINFVCGKNYDAGKVELVPVVDNCVIAGDLYKAKKHTVSIYEIVGT